MLATFSLAILLLISTGPAGAAPAALVHDHRGKPVEVGIWYYMVPIRRDIYRGFFSGTRNGTSCPIYINEAPVRFPGIAAKFAPIDGGKTVRVSTNLNVEFYETNICPEKPIWTLAFRDEATGQRFVRYGGVIGNPGFATLNNWFRIVEDGDNYKLVFCPIGVCSTCKDVVCGDLGIYGDAFGRWLVLNGQYPLTVKFKKFKR